MGLSVPRIPASVSAMTDPTPAPQPVTPGTHRRPTIPQAILLGWVSGGSALLALVLAIWGASIRPNIFLGFDESAARAQASLGAWADIFLLIAVCSTVGLVVLSGVRRLLEGR